MKKTKFLTAGLIAAMMIPAAAQAQSRYQGYDRPVAGKSQPHVRDNRQGYRPDQRDWRRDNRYQNWRAPFRYQSFRTGSTLRSNYYAPNYRMSWDSRWSLPRAGQNQAYVRHYDDLLLVNVRSGKVVRVYRNHFRWR
ncbi:MAG TPA: RcnB family protein [Sphingopyxis sp.]|nr:RcnB family protein [Sphingopyxis sp.]HMP45371.1 RcnB family protein [Sphingopyxis sp.]HMQ18406.1 RcnB family protein [Sphingopyxis sp.]